MQLDACSCYGTHNSIEYLATGTFVLEWQLLALNCLQRWTALENHGGACSGFQPALRQVGARHGLSMASASAASIALSPLPCSSDCRSLVLPYPCSDEGARGRGCRCARQGKVRFPVRIDRLISSQHTWASKDATSNLLPMASTGQWRRGRDSNPRRCYPHTISNRAH